MCCCEQYIGKQGDKIVYDITFETLVDSCLSTARIDRKRDNPSFYIYIRLKAEAYINLWFASQEYCPVTTVWVRGRNSKTSSVPFTVIDDDHHSTNLRQSFLVSQTGFVALSVWQWVVVLSPHCLPPTYHGRGIISAVFKLAFLDGSETPAHQQSWQVVFLWHEWLSKTSAVIRHVLAYTTQIYVTDGLLALKLWLLGLTVKITVGWPMFSCNVFDREVVMLRCTMHHPRLWVTIILPLVLKGHNITRVKPLHSAALELTESYTKSWHGTS